MEMCANLSKTLLPVTPRNLEKAASQDSCNDAENTECNCNELSYGDAIFSGFVVAPLVVSMWRGTWGLMELHGEFFPHAQIYLMGIVIHVCFALVRSQLLARSAGAWSAADGNAGRWLRERVVSRCYTYVFILACIMHWRGGWGLFDAAVLAILPDDDDPHSQVASYRSVLIGALTALFYMCIATLRSSRNLLAPPYFLFTDGKEPTYIFATRFKKDLSKVCIKQIFL